MPLDTNFTDKCYLYGRSIAYINQIVGEEKLPQAFITKCLPGMDRGVFDYWSQKALKTEEPEFVKVMKQLGDELPKVDNGSFWIGYYHQKAEIERVKARIRLGNKIAAKRREKGLSIRELARLSGVDKSNILNVEKGFQSAGIDLITKLCAVLGLELTID